jgi:hypothetical protein
MRPRWPLPIGVKRSITRVVSVVASVSSRMACVGSVAVSSSQFDAVDLLDGRQSWPRLPAGRWFERTRDVHAVREFELVDELARHVRIVLFSDEVACEVAKKAVPARVTFQHALNQGWGRLHSNYSD